MFRVRWEKRALNELSMLWTAADPVMRKIITAATNQIDEQLGADPMANSESRPGGRRILFASPLGITFRVESDGKTISVLRVWLFRRHGQP